MISRIWHGYTHPKDANAYDELLKHDVLVDIQDRHISGFQEIQLFRRELGDEVEFITIMWFDSLDAVRAFAGKDHEVAVVPPKARAILKRFDTRSQHYEVKARRTGGGVAVI